IDFAIARLTSYGALDPSFGTGGIETTTFPDYPNTKASAFALLPDGSSVLAGTYWPLNGNRDFALVRYTPDGIPDSSFGNNGIVTHDFGTVEAAFALAVAAD